MAESKTQEFEVKDNVLYIKGISSDFKEEDLRKIFNPYGCITSAKIYRKELNDKNVNPIAFVNFDCIKSADNAMEAMNDCNVKGCLLNISKAKKRIEYNKSPVNECPAKQLVPELSSDEVCSDRLLVKGLPISYTEEKLRKLFEPFGRIVYVVISCDLKSSSKLNFGFVQFFECLNAFMALNKLNETSIEGNQMVISFADPIHKESECQIRSKMNISVEKVIDISNTTIEELDNELLAEVFTYLSIKQKFAVSRVCRLWKEICDQLMEYETALAFGRTAYPYDYGCDNQSHKVNDYNDVSDAIIDANNKLWFSPKNFPQLVPMIRLTYNIESLQFANCFIDTIAFKWIISQCPKLKCLTFDNIEGIGELDWPKIGKPLSAKIVHFSYGGNKLNKWKSLSRMVNSFNILKELTIFDCLQDLETVFQDLSQTVTNLCVRECKTFNLKAVTVLLRKNGPKIQNLIIDFNGVEESKAIIDCIYARIPDFHSFNAFNIYESEIECFNHENYSNQMTIVFNQFIDFELMSEKLRESLKFIRMTGFIKPSAFQLIYDMIPNCEEFILSDCYFYCECDSNADKLLCDRFYSCFNCYEVSIDFFIHLPKLKYLEVNGFQYLNHN